MNKTKTQTLKKNTLLLIVIVQIIILLASCQSTQIPSSKGAMHVQFCPFENCSKTFLESAKDATQITCAFYNVDDESLIHMLKQKEANLIVDDHAKIDLPKRIGEGIMHHKFCVFDKKKVITGSFNPKQSEFDNYNNIITIESKPIAEFYLNSFNQLLTKRTVSKNNNFIHNNNKISVFVCPQDSCNKRILQEINDAEKSILFALFTFTDEQIAQALIQKHNQGIHIIGIIESFQSKKYNQYYTLKENNIQVYLEQSNILQHNKVFIIDNKTIITGSYNPTKAAYTINDENILIIHNGTIAQLYTEYVNYIIQRLQ